MMTMTATIKKFFCQFPKNYLVSSIAVLFFLIFSIPVANAQIFKKKIDYEKIFTEGLSRNGKTLNLGGKKIGDLGVNKLLESDFLKKVTRIDLRYNEITEKGALALASIPTLSNLKSLVLRKNDISDNGTISLANSQSFPNLTELQLGWNEIHDPGGLALANSKNFQKLKKLDLRGNFLASATKKALQKQLPHIKKLRFF
jgi:Ran GTPase-activating protein (RanGAP) involved in mRNA processing and transport